MSKKKKPLMGLKDWIYIIYCRDLKDYTTPEETGINKQALKQLEEIGLITTEVVEGETRIKLTTPGRTEAILYKCRI